MTRFLTALFLSVFLPSAALAQSADRPNTILVLDGSGSMWGQIDEINKIVIAREVIADLLADMPDDEVLGLTVYGHRRRGDCSDIETIIDPAPFTQDAILEAVNAINPRGRTPMTDAVVAAAQSLRHTEEAATVILVSDGVETCDADPCAIAAELEAAGIAFTAHVVGFDVSSEPEARAQMQCIADNTGGLFLSADNASELSEALETVVTAARPTPMRLEAQIEPTGALVTRPVTWRIIGEANTIIADGLTGASVDFAFDAGLYTIEATRQEPAGPVTYSINTIVEQGRTDLIIVRMPEIVETVPVTFRAAEAPGGSAPTSPLTWTLQEADGTPLLGPVETPGGNVNLLPGDYQIAATRMVDGAEVTANFTVVDTSLEVVLEFPEFPFPVSFTAVLGDASGDVITDPIVWTITPGIGELTATTNPASTDITSGTYRVEAYWTAQEITATADFDLFAASRDILVIFPEQLPEATVTAPATAVAGSTIEVAWTGPDNRNDYIGIGLATAERHEQWQNFTYTNEGSPLSLLVPPAPGEHVIRYFLDEGRVAIGETTITVTPAEASITAPAEAIAGSTVEIGWTGPDYRNDYIGIGAVGAERHEQWENFTYTRDGSPLNLLIPTEPGDYVIRYFLDQDRVSIAEVPISVTDVQASITAPQTAIAGSTIEVTWTGPDNRNDYIGIGRADAERSDQWENFTYTRDGSPLNLLIPTTPGDYVIRYFLDQDRVSIAEVPISVTEVQASITAPQTAVAGSTIEVTWTGPDNRNDYIGIGEVGAERADQWENFTYTRDGSPLDLLVPVRPGTYAIRYFLDQDRVSIAETLLNVTAVQATLTAPASGKAGDTIEVTWDGPDYRNDYIAIGPVGAERSDQWEAFAYTNRGNPAVITLPDTPGQYVIQYFLDQDRVSIGSIPLTIE